jgi:hypothetical protein
VGKSDHFSRKNGEKNRWKQKINLLKPTRTLANPNGIEEWILPRISKQVAYSIGNSEEP